MGQRRETKLHPYHFAQQKEGSAVTLIILDLRSMW